MVWDDQRFENLVSLIILTTEGKKRPIDFPFYRFRYEPEFEFRCIEEFIRLQKRLKLRSTTSIEIVWLNRLFIDALNQYDSINSLIESECNDRKSLFDSLSNPNHGLPHIISNKLSNHLREKNIDHCAILLRAGSIFPFVQISSLLSRLENKVRCVIVIPCPEKEGRILAHGREIMNNYYRGEII